MNTCGSEAGDKFLMVSSSSKYLGISFTGLFLNFWDSVKFPITNECEEKVVII
jgi:hypothetical protein